jgi:N-acetylmuramoyl-L-alanine amidase
MRINTDYIIIHCSATPPSMDIGAREIRAWHKERGWTDIGYHHVINRHGKLEMGRPTLFVGAHARGFNRTSVGICLVGGVDNTNHPDANYTVAQWEALARLVTACKNMYREAVVLGHRDLPGVTKDCPCFDVPAWWNKL